MRSCGWGWWRLWAARRCSHWWPGGRRGGAGEVVGVLGPNGAGKTSLLRAGLGLAPLERGEARLGDKAIGSLSEAERAARVGYLPQERRVAWNIPAWRAAALGAVLAPPKE